MLRLTVLVLAVAGPVAVGMGLVWGWSFGTQGAVGGAWLIGGVGLSIGYLRRNGIDEALLAAHLDRTTPQLEESTALLLRAPESLSVVERLQQRRVFTAFKQMPAPLPAPAQGLRVAGLLAGLSMLLSSGLVAWVPRPLVGHAERDAASVPMHTTVASPEQMPIRVEQAQVTVTPPAYTRQPAATSGELNLTALQQARAAWGIDLNQPVEEAVLVFSSGDTLALHPDPAGTYRAEMSLRASGFYYLVCTKGQQRARSDFYALTLLEDLPPVFIVMQPEPRTIIEPGAPMQVALHVLADDDFGLDDARLIATVSKGSGESVKFREQAFGFDTVTKTSLTAWVLEKNLDLHALGMEPGDELFFFIEGWDNQAPTPNRGRSETLFVVVQDTSQWASVPSLGLALSPAEEYLRSQRQIIIDTEQLIADQPDISREAFQQRSNNIGIDQKLLRLRYGQFLGEELVSTVTQDEQFAPGQGDEHTEDEHSGEAAVETSLEAAEAIIAQYGHAHDTEEGATFYSEDIKRELKAALAEMWDAELHLRTYRPEAALPYEYRALRILKALQQKSRIYVKRIGFEPPPLKPDEARLTGKLDAVQSRSEQRDAQAEEPFPAIREALAVLSVLDASPENPREVIGVLERAGVELAEKAVAEAGQYLVGLQALRALIDELETQRTVCQACKAAVRRAFWTALPPAGAVPIPRREGPTSLSQRYFNQLGR